MPSVTGEKNSTYEINVLVNGTLSPTTAVTALKSEHHQKLLH